MARGTQVNRLQDFPFERQIGNDANVQGDQRDDVELIVAVHTPAVLTGSPYVIQIANSNGSARRHFLCTTSCLHLNPIQLPFVFDHDVIRETLFGEIRPISR